MANGPRSKLPSAHGKLPTRRRPLHRPAEACRPPSSADLRRETWTAAPPNLPSVQRPERRSDGSFQSATVRLPGGGGSLPRRGGGFRRTRVRRGAAKEAGGLARERYPGRRRAAVARSQLPSLQRPRRPRDGGFRSSRAGGSPTWEASLDATEGPGAPGNRTAPGRRLPVQQGGGIRAGGSGRRRGVGWRRAGARDGAAVGGSAQAVFGGFATRGAYRLAMEASAGHGMDTGGERGTKKGGVPEHAPEAKLPSYTVSRFAEWDAGAGGLPVEPAGGVTAGGGAGAGVSGVGFALVRPRNGCRPNSASFSDRMP